MQILRSAIALALLAGALPAQQPSGVGADTTVRRQLDSSDSLRLSRAQAIATALAHNPQIQVASAQLRQAEARHVEVTSIDDPIVSASYDEQPGFFRSATGGQKNVGVGFTVPFPDKLRLRGSVAVADVRSARSFYALVRQTVEAQASEAYDSLLVAQVHRADLVEAQGLARDFLSRTQARFLAGTAARLDVIRAQVAVAQAGTDLLANARDVENAAASLERLMGTPIGSPIAPTDSLTIPPPLPTLDRLLAVALQARPEVSSIVAQRAGARAATKLAKEFWLPDLTMGVARDYNQPNPALFSTGVSFPFPLFPWQHTKGDIAEARFRESELAASERDVRAQVTQDVRAAYANAVISIQQVAFIRDELLPAARAAYRSASASYSLGGSSALDVQDARRSLLDAEEQYADALVDANVQRAELQRAVSVPLDTIGPGTSR
jgi:outer membrane protein, heavy metal efflux system